MDTVHECDRQTDGRTDRRTDRITITKTVQRRASHGKMLVRHELTSVIELAGVVHMLSLIALNVYNYGFNTKTRQNARTKCQLSTPEDGPLAWVAGTWCVHSVAFS